MNSMCFIIIILGVKYSRIVNGGFTSSRTPHQNNRPSSRTRGRD